VCTWVDATTQYVLDTKFGTSAFDYGQATLQALENPHSGVLPENIEKAKQEVSQDASVFARLSDRLIGILGDLE
jgi:hypothetical protein